MKNFGALLREYRRRSGKTLGDVARHLDVSIPYMSDVERGNRAPFTPERIVALAAFFDVDSRPLLIAAADSRGAFELDARKSDLHQEVGAALMRGWTELAPEDLNAIAQILQKKGPHQ